MLLCCRSTACCNSFWCVVELGWRRIACTPIECRCSQPDHHTTDLELICVHIGISKQILNLVLLFCTRSLSPYYLRSVKMLGRWHDMLKESQIGLGRNCFSRTLPHPPTLTHTIWPILIGCRCLRESLPVTRNSPRILPEAAHFSTTDYDSWCPNTSLYPDQECKHNPQSTFHNHKILCHDDGNMLHSHIRLPYYLFTT